MKSIFNYFIYFYLTILIVSSCKKLEKIAKLPTVYLIGASKISNTSIDVMGQFTWNGDSPLLARGVCYSLLENPTVSDSIIEINEDVSDFKLTISGLTKNTNYYIRAFAKNIAGIGYSESIKVKTSNIEAQLAIVITNPISNITDSSVQLSGKIINDGGGQILSKGFCLSKTKNPTINDIKVEVSGSKLDYDSVVKSLAKNTSYYVKAFVLNSVGVSYGNELEFKIISSGKLNVKTLSVSNISYNDAMITGQIITDSLFPIIQKGFCWNTKSNPTVNDSKIINESNELTFSNKLMNLEPGVKYYIKTFSTNEKGVVYGNELVFRTNQPSSGYGKNIVDIEGNTYKTVYIGDQHWMAENLKVEKFNDGTSIPNIQDNQIWKDSKTPACSNYDNDILMKDEYGKLYNGYVIVPSDNSNNNVCPSGWHVPTMLEWNTLYNYINQNIISLKEVGSSHWNIGINTNDKYLFSALAGGVRFSDGNYQFYGLKNFGSWWSSSVSYTESLYYFYYFEKIYTGNSYQIPTNSKKNGLSIRCIKD
jgi:uncharacterized protein (TIGR02145 family)